MQVGAAWSLSGKRVLMPLGDFQRYDLVFDDDGRFFRVQCKMARMFKGALHFATCSIDSRSQKGTCIRKGYMGQIEFFGVYCPYLKKCYLVPVEDTPLTERCLRLEPPKNGQKTRIRWAADYEIRSEPLLIEDTEST
jgi:hypothetical protein